jgi:ATP-binding cassette subfamily B protein
MQGVQNEERTDLTKAESKSVRQRSQRLLISLIKPVRSRLLLSLSVVVISQALRVLGPAIIAFGIDKALPQALKQDWVPLFWTIGFYLMAAASTATLTSWFLIFSSKINQDVLVDMRERIFVHTQKLSLEFHEKYTSGRVIARQTSDLDSIKELLDSGLNDMVSGLLYMVFTAVALLLLDSESFLLLLVSLVPLFFLTRWFQTRTRTEFRKTRVASARLIVHFVETMTGIRAVKAFRKEAENERVYKGLVEDYRFVNARVIQLFGIYDPGLIMIGNVTVASILLLGGIRVIDDGLGLGILTASILYARRFFDPMEGLAMFYNSYQSASSALEKVSGVLQEEPSVAEVKEPTPLPDAKGSLTFDAVEFHYSNGKTVLPTFD